MSCRIGAAIAIALLAFCAPASAKELRFAGIDFRVKAGRALGPGPNDWSADHAFVDGKGRLHLKFAKESGRWRAAEVSSLERLGFGTYKIEYDGEIAGLDRNMVFGFFNYPTEDVGPHETNEIDIEFSRWGDQANKPLSYTVWPADRRVGETSRSFSFPRRAARSIHRFVWSREKIDYTSVALDGSGATLREVRYTFAPTDFARRISASPMPIYFNLGVFVGVGRATGRRWRWSSGGSALRRSEAAGGVTAVMPGLDPGIHLRELGCFRVPR